MKKNNKKRNPAKRRVFPVRADFKRSKPQTPLAKTPDTNKRKVQNLMITCWDLFDEAVNTAKAPRVLVCGPYGLAKSYNAQESLRRRHKVVAQVSLNDDVAAQELMGHYVPKGAIFEWHDGPVTEAYRNGTGLIVNEISRASGAVQDMFLSILDDPKVSMITIPNGEHVRPGEKFQVIATSNHDPSRMAPELQDRFDAIITVDRPHPSLILHINNQRDGLGTIIMDSYKTPAHAISPRRALSFLMFSDHGLEDGIALALAFGVKAKDIGMALKAFNVKREKSTKEPEAVDVDF